MKPKVSVETRSKLVEDADEPSTSKVVTGGIESMKKLALAVERFPMLSATAAEIVCVPCARAKEGTKAAEEAVTAARVVIDTPSRLNWSVAVDTPLPKSE